jgi:hypothetical protein
MENGKRAGMEDVRSLYSNRPIYIRWFYSIDHPWSYNAAPLLFGAIRNAVPGIGWMFAFAFGMLYSVAPALRYQELKDVHSGRQRKAEQEEEAEAV